VVKFLLWCILFVLCWPLALGALLLYPIVWLLLLPFRILGIAVDAVLSLVWAIVMLPSAPRFCPRLIRRPHSSILRKRKALEITETELNVIAAAASIGLSRIPKNG